MWNADVYYNKEQLVMRTMTRLHLLEKRGLLRCNYIENTNIVDTPHSKVIEVRINGKRIAFDLGDRSGLNHQNAENYLASVDVYFERSHEDWSSDSRIRKYLHKVKPYGFDYYVTYLGNPAQEQPDSFVGKATELVRQIIGYTKCMQVDYFEGKADYKNRDIKIIFMTRLWDPDEIKLHDGLSPEVLEYRQYMICERQKINRERIYLVKELKKRYGNNFTGGIQYSDFAAKECPELLLPRKLTRKKAYLDAMKKSDICIGSVGLHKSISWKTGEYVAAARAIVCERFAYMVPGEFSEGKNYIPYDNVEECLAAVDYLFQNYDAIYEMKKKTKNIIVIIFALNNSY